MTPGGDQVLTNQQLIDYEAMGFVHGIPILSDEEISHYRAEVEKTCQAIGSRVTRLDGLHLFFRWAWELSTHPRLLDCLEQLLGPDILLKSTRVFYKHAKTGSYVGWHQDGITERLEDGRAPAVWLGLTAATVENGCLRVVPGSHRLGLLRHESSPDLPPLPDEDPAALVSSWSAAYGDELSGRITRVPIDVASRCDLVMRPGEMSIHHPVTLHGSNANVSTDPRIGLSASYSAPGLYRGRRAVVWARGDGARGHHSFDVIDSAPTATFADAVAAYRSSDRQILFALDEK
jgi:non-haem Fe2+, alpha-ketoglutarate-dependent halogenase